MYIPKLKEKNGAYTLTDGYSEWAPVNISHGVQLTKKGLLHNKSIIVLRLPKGKKREFVSVIYCSAGHPTSCCHFSCMEKSAMKMINDQIEALLT